MLTPICKIWYHHAPYHVRSIYKIPLSCSRTLMFHLLLAMFASVQKQHLFKRFKPLSGSLSYLVLILFKKHIYIIGIVISLVEWSLSHLRILKYPFSYDRIIKYM